MLVTLSTTLVLVILFVVLHYETIRMLRQAGNCLHRHDAWHRFHLSILVCGLLITHVLEVMLFSWAYCGPIDGNGYGALVGGQAADIAECTCFSFANYTWLGYGDLVPLGPLRFMAGMEALTATGIDRLDGIVHVFADAQRLGARAIMTRYPRAPAVQR